MRRYERELAELERFGRDHFQDGDVVRFVKRYETEDVLRTGETGREYVYAAIKTPRGWSLTGQGRKNSMLTYDDLIAFVIQHPAAEQVQVAAHWLDVTTIDHEAERGLAKNPNTARQIDEFLADPAAGRSRDKPHRDEPRYARVNYHIQGFEAMKSQSQADRDVDDENVH